MAAALRVAVAAANHGHLTTLCPFLLRPLSNTITNKALNHNRNLKGLSRKSFTCRAVYNPEEVQIKEEGQSESPEYRVFLVDRSGKKVSPWHDIPLRLGNGIFNFVVEIPKDTRAKMEVATDEPYTPIKPRHKEGKTSLLPFLVGNVQSPFLDIKEHSASYFLCALNSYNINWNYGLLPQTWEDPSFENSKVEGAVGDNDPVDVVEIGSGREKLVRSLRSRLAALAMIDEGELDWKLRFLTQATGKSSHLENRKEKFEWAK
ncbi:Soluble inorganic pyrophosphatase 1, chloroplastic [Morella rubra]|uniref:inorganic diphosphatase n=1 Tax=Morella rubra TaxID=262757 RepID=A0A6A1VH07_9ROSI|nr:Soluble inorganic pyrophosphatase 1, chloroplastic [Morella rubra]